MPNKKRCTLADEDRRIVVVSVRLTEREDEVVEALRAVYRCSRSSLLRMMCTLSLPEAVPAFNIEAFSALDRIAFQLSELEDIKQWAAGPIAAQLAAVKASLDRLRDTLIGVTA